MCLLQKNPAGAECNPRAAAQDTALRAVKVLTSCQILLEPMCNGHQHVNASDTQLVCKLPIWRILDKRISPHQKFELLQ